MNSDIATSELATAASKLSFCGIQTVRKKLNVQAVDGVWQKLGLLLLLSLVTLCNHDLGQDFRIGHFERSFREGGGLDRLQGSEALHPCASVPHGHACVVSATLPASLRCTLSVPRGMQRSDAVNVAETTQA